MENEIEILRKESEGKDHALVKERFESEHTLKERDTLRHDTNKMNAVLVTKRSQEEQNVSEIAKLNTIINSAEAELIRMKRDFERAVQQRNYVGIQLIDRNDELCILYEKSNVHEGRLRQAEIQYRVKEQEARLLSLRMAEIQREIGVYRKLLPKIPEYENALVTLMEQLRDERARGVEICAKLEDPSNVDRYNALGGTDPTPDELVRKVQVLEGRLNQKDEQLLEKKLLLDQVTALTDRARREASEGREGTLQLATRVNEFQVKIKNLTRRMMAIVSELSVYRATALKLEQEKTDLEGTLETARSNMDQGLPPTADAEQEWLRMERNRMRAIEDRMALTAEQEAEEIPGVTRTTAEPRVNAYIPDDDLGIPKPYGSRAPFKPSEAGSTMRHIRKPVQKEIEI